MVGWSQTKESTYFPSDHQVKVIFYIKKATDKWSLSIPNTLDELTKINWWASLAGQIPQSFYFEKGKDDVVPWKWTLRGRRFACAKFFGKYSEHYPLCDNKKKVGLGRDRRWVRGRPQPISWGALELPMLTAEFQKLDKGSQSLYLSHQITWFKLPWEGMTHFLRSWELSFAWWASTLPEPGEMGNSIPGRKVEDERLFLKLLLGIPHYGCSYPTGLGTNVGFLPLHTIIFSETGEIIRGWVFWPLELNLA